mmetsp:Transcript_37482/g.38169  ORF Transcript_37482/g.38169 Transcript_37482/m.38169 type:complete len:219 (+) Transcript_37482:142-798(+)
MSEYNQYPEEWDTRYNHALVVNYTQMLTAKVQKLEEEKQQLEEENRHLLEERKQFFPKKVLWKYQDPIAIDMVSSRSIKVKKDNIISSTMGCAVTGMSSCSFPLNKPSFWKVTSLQGNSIGVGITKLLSPSNVIARLSSSNNDSYFFFHWTVNFLEKSILLFKFYPQVNALNVYNTLENKYYSLNNIDAARYSLVVYFYDIASIQISNVTEYEKLIFV